MKTAIKELIDKFEDIQNNNCKTLQERIFFDGVLAITQTFIEKEKKQIKQSFNDGISQYAQYDPERHGNEGPNPEQYYNNNYNNYNN